MVKNDIEKTILSIQNQTFTDFEYIVVDGGFYRWNIGCNISIQTFNYQFYKVSLIMVYMMP